MTKAFLLSIQSLTIVPVIAATIVAAIRFPRLDATMRILAYLVFFDMGMEILARGLIYTGHTNLFLLPADTMAEFGLLALLYRRVLAPSAVSRWLPAVIVGFSASSLLSYVDYEGLFRFNTGQRFAESLLLIGLVLCYFYKLTRELTVTRLEREPLFWVSVAVLLYFAGNAFVFISINYVLQRSMALSSRLWDVHAVLYMVLYGTFAWALWISRPLTRR